MPSATHPSSPLAQVFLGLMIPVAPIAFVAIGMPAARMCLFMSGGLLIVGAGMGVPNVLAIFRLLKTMAAVRATDAPDPSVETLRSAIADSGNKQLLTLWVLFLSGVFGLLSNTEVQAWLVST
jgi:hypothetical protein